MASLGERSNGRFFVRFVDPDGMRRTIALGTSSERQATGIKLKIENLVAARFHNQPVDPETAKWISRVKDMMLDKLIDAGLIDAPDAPDGSDLAMAFFAAIF